MSQIRVVCGLRPATRMATQAAHEPTETLEQGEIYFFYRPKLGVDEVRGRPDVQRLYMVLAAKRPRSIYRLFVVGRKKLPEVTPGRQHPERRNWALNVLTSRKLEDLRRELGSFEYATKTRGTRVAPPAEPVGQGLYQLLRHGDHTELAYALRLPRVPGPAQEEFAIEDEASYVVAVKNPDVSTPGAPSSSRPPKYPKRLREKFGSRRWIPVDDPALLDYENTQLLLLGAHTTDVEEELGVRLDVGDEKRTAEQVCRSLRGSCNREEVQPLLTGEFPQGKEEPAERPGKTPAAPHVCPYDGEAFDQKSRFERHMASAHPPSAVTAADLEKALAGIDYPKSKQELVEYAARRVPADSDVMRAIRALPDRTYRDAAEVALGFGEEKAPAGAHPRVETEPPSVRGGHAAAR